MKYLIVILFVLVQIFVNQNIGYSTNSYWYNHFIYQFQHTGWMHLILNSIAFIGFYNALTKGTNGLLIILYAYIGSVVASYLSVYDIPTIGSSGMVYTMVGLLIVQAFMGKRLRILNKKAFYMLLGCLAICFLISVLKGTANNLCHVFGLISGGIIAFIDGRCKGNNRGE